MSLAVSGAFVQLCKTRLSSGAGDHRLASTYWDIAKYRLLSAWVLKTLESQAVFAAVRGRPAARRGTAVRLAKSPLALLLQSRCGLFREMFVVGHPVKAVGLSQSRKETKGGRSCAFLQ